MQDTIARYDFLLKTYQSWLTDLTKLTVRHGICHQNIYPSHYLTLSTLYFPDTGPVPGIVPQCLYRMIYNKTKPEPLSIQNDLRLSLETDGQLLFTHGGLEGVLLSECVRLKQRSLANKLISLIQQFNNVEYRHKLVWLFWYDRMLGAPLDDWLENLKKMDDGELYFWLLQRQEENAELAHLMDEYVNFTYY
ncbi:hypothetical protein [Serratia fonticola]|uniref:hypothetical protein n=1 Tax=Serratia fonticola TaxID=47917 RepID=UPI001646A36C|nr:hypothetical protein [Serratia fonticola]MBC3219959.1 hypothetical protein [Serratia fonticola]